MTYRQCQKLGGQVRKGEKSTIAIFYKSYTKEVENAEGGADTENRRVLEAYDVFTADQCDGLTAFSQPTPPVAALDHEGPADRLVALMRRFCPDRFPPGSPVCYGTRGDRCTEMPADQFAQAARRANM